MSAPASASETAVRASSGKEASLSTVKASGSTAPDSRSRTSSGDPARRTTPQ